MTEICENKNHLHYRNLYTATTYCPVYKIEWTWEDEMSCKESTRSNKGHLTITSPINGNKVCLFCGEIVK